MNQFSLFHISVPISLMQKVKINLSLCLILEYEDKAPHILNLSIGWCKKKENVQQLCLTVSYWLAFVRKIL
jgi:hypothetical protein